MRCSREASACVHSSRGVERMHEPVEPVRAGECRVCMSRCIYAATSEISHINCDVSAARVLSPIE